MLGTKEQSKADVLVNTAADHQGHTGPRPHL